MLFVIDNKSMKVFESMQVPNHAKHKSEQVVYQGLKSYHINQEHVMKSHVNS